MAKRIILASASPRRQAILGKIVEDFEVIPSNAEERISEDRTPVETAMSNALAKAEYVAAENPDAVVIGADTIVVHRGRIFGKPEDREDALSMLRLFSNDAHMVVTGVAVCCIGKGISLVEHEKTDVRFHALDDAAMNDYLDSHGYMDKAGSYGIQDAGERFIKRVDGDIDNVIGLPLKLVSRMLNEMDKNMGMQ